MGSSLSSSSCKYDVFINFRGGDTRDNFTSHLVAALRDRNVKTFIDEEIRRGDEISTAISDAIEASKISIIIFSEDYASSKWCLNELVKILECRKNNGQIVIPVFYKVDRSDVCYQSGSFRDAFVMHEGQFQEHPENVQKWRDGLTEASLIVGLDSMEFRYLLNLFICEFDNVVVLVNF